MVAHLFLIADEAECETAIAMIESGGLADSAILKLTNEPYFAHDFAHTSRHVKEWEEYEVRQSKFAIYATSGYKQAESIFSNFLGSRNGEVLDYMEHKAFQLPLVMDFGREYLSPIFIFNGFIVKTNPGILFMNERAGLATELLSALARAYGIPLKSLEAGGTDP